MVDTCGFKSNLTNSQPLDDDFSKNLDENHYSTLLVSGFTKPNIKDLVMFFKFHPIQASDNVPYNSLIAYFYNNHAENHKRTWLSYTLNKSFYCIFCLPFLKIDNLFTIGCTFNNKNACNRISEHEKSNDHKNCVDAYLLQSKEKDLYNFFSVAKKYECSTRTYN